MKGLKCNYFLLLLALLFCFCSWLSLSFGFSPASAVDFSSLVQLQEVSNGRPGQVTYVGTGLSASCSGVPHGVVSETEIAPGKSLVCSSLRFTGGETPTVNSNSYVSAIFRVRTGYTEAGVGNYRVTASYLPDNNSRIVTLQQVAVDDFYDYWEVVITNWYNYSGEINIPVIVQNTGGGVVNAATGSIWVDWVSWSIWSRAGLSVDVDTDNSDVVDKITQTSQQQIAAIQQQSQQQHQDAQNQLNATNENTEAIKDQTDQQKEQYEQDKEEESDRENQGKDDAEQIGGLFNFNVLNPLAGIFGLFKDGSSCASIPTISQWVHYDKTIVCPWFPAQVRSVLTPVLGFASTMILFGFVVHWLNKFQEF